MRPLLVLLFMCLALFAQIDVFTWDGADAYTVKKCLSVPAHGASPAEQMQWEFYFGYVQGIAEALNKDAWCLPSHYRQDEIAQVVVKYISDHPNELHRNRALAVGLALREAFPCQK